MKSSVAVVGAGTSGLITAKRLAELGVGTTVYDQKKTPGFPIRASGILSITGLGTLGLQYKKAMTNTLQGARLHVGKERIDIRAEKPVAYVLDRLKLNELCMEEAEDAGAKVVTNTKVDGGLLDELASNEILVGADGTVSTVARHFGFPPIGKHILTYRAEYDYRLPESDMVELFFDNSFAPGFFGWICPNSKGIAEIGIGVDSKHGNSRAWFEKFKKAPDVSDIVRSGKLIDEGASVIPVGLRRHFVDSDREILLVGDAAGQVKPTTGGGIIFGGNGARYAAGAIDSHIRHGESLMEYERKWRREFAKEMKLHSFFYSLYSSLGKKKLEVVAKAVKAAGMESFLGRYGDMDRPSVVIKRFFLRGLAK